MSDSMCIIEFPPSGVVSTRDFLDRLKDAPDGKVYLAYRGKLCLVTRVKVVGPDVELICDPEGN